MDSIGGGAACMIRFGFSFGCRLQEVLFWWFRVYVYLDCGYPPVLKMRGGMLTPIM